MKATENEKKNCHCCYRFGEHIFLHMCNQETVLKVKSLHYAVCFPFKFMYNFEQCQAFEINKIRSMILLKHCKRDEKKREKMAIHMFENLFKLILPLVTNNSIY